MTETVLVAGGAGYVGSHTCKALARAGYLPVVYDNLVSGHEWAVKWGPLERGDILDANRLGEVMRHHRPTALFHFAAFASVSESVAAPAKYYRNNVVGTLNLLDAALAAGIKRVVFSSTCSVYGLPESLPIDEMHPLKPISPYGRTKMIVEGCLQDYGRASGLKSISLRYFNAAGADPDGDIGEEREHETHLIPIAFDAALGRRSHLTVFGSGYATPDGTCIRDYVHVTDLADAHVAALAHLDGREGTASFNLGSGVGTSVKEIVDAVRELSGRDFSVSYGDPRPGDPPSLVASTGRAHDELGWRPMLSDTQTILKTAWSWRESRR